MGRGINNLLYGQVKRNMSINQSYSDSDTDSGSFNDYSFLLQQLLDLVGCSTTSVKMNQDVIQYQQDKFKNDIFAFQPGMAAEEDLKDLSFSGTSTWFIRKPCLPKWIKAINQPASKHLQNLEDEFNCFTGYHQENNRNLSRTKLVIPMFTNNKKDSRYDFQAEIDWLNKSPFSININLLDLLSAEKAVAKKGQWVYTEGTSEGFGNHYLLYIADSEVQAAIKPGYPF